MNKMVEVFLNAYHLMHPSQTVNKNDALNCCKVVLTGVAERAANPLSLAKVFSPNIVNKLQILINIIFRIVTDVNYL